jgi:hypothetical protein
MLVLSEKQVPGRACEGGGIAFVSLHIGPALNVPRDRGHMLVM